jgi:hypothetical protein
VAEIYGQTIALGLSGPTKAPVTKPVIHEKNAHRHVVDFAAANFGKKSQQPKSTKIHSQTFRT